MLGKREIICQVKSECFIFYFVFIIIKLYNYYKKLYSHFGYIAVWESNRLLGVQSHFWESNHTFGSPNNFWESNQLLGVQSNFWVQSNYLNANFEKLSEEISVTLNGEKQLWRFYVSLLPNYAIPV